MTRTLTGLLEGGAFFEGPRWHDGRWWVSDFYRGGVYTVAVDGSAQQVLTCEQQPSGLGWLPDGSLLIASMRDQRVLRRDLDGQVGVHADLRGHFEGHLNDIVVDGRGRAWVATSASISWEGPAHGRPCSCGSIPMARWRWSRTDCCFPTVWSSPRTTRR